MYFPYRKEAPSCIRDRHGLRPKPHAAFIPAHPRDAEVAAKAVQLFFVSTSNSSKQGDSNETLGNTKR